MNTKELEKIVKEAEEWGDKLKELYDNLSEEELQRACVFATNNIFYNDELANLFHDTLYHACSDTFYEYIEPMRHCHFDIPNQGDVLVMYGNKKIQLLCNYPNNGEITILYKGNEFPAYWAMSSDFCSQEACCYYLHHIMNELIGVDKIVYPFVQMWEKDLNKWHEEGFNDKDLTKLEMILEDYYDKIEDPDWLEIDMIKECYDQKISLYDFAQCFPSRIKEVVKFNRNNNENLDKELSGEITLRLYDGNNITIFIEATKRSLDPWNKNSDKYYWDAHHFQAIDKPFPKFSKYDKKKIEDYLLENYPL